MKVTCDRCGSAFGDYPDGFTAPELCHECENLTVEKNEAPDLRRAVNSPYVLGTMTGQRSNLGRGMISNAPKGPGRNP